MADWMRSRTPMRRLGELQELVGPFLFLASDASSFVTGTVITDRRRLERERRLRAEAPAVGRVVRRAQPTDRTRLITRS